MRSEGERIEANWRKAYQLFKDAIQEANNNKCAMCIVDDGVRGGIKIVDRDTINNSPFRYTLLITITPHAYKQLIVESIV